MNDLDQMLRDGLRAATDGVDGVDPTDLAHRLEQRRATAWVSRVSPSHSGRRRRLAVGAAAVVLLVVAAAALWSTARDSTSRQDVVAEDPPSTSAVSTTAAPSLEQPAPVGLLDAPAAPVEEWVPGWYQLDVSGLPATRATPIRFDGELVVTATPADEFADGTRVYRRDQRSGAWSEMARLPLSNAAVVAAGDRLVAVGMQGYSVPPAAPAWAVLAEDASEWRLQGSARSDASVAMRNYMGPMLVWTGERVVDVADAVVLDPATGRADALEVDDETALSLHARRAVWTGDRVVVPRWDGSGWAWDARGRDLGEVPAAAADASPATPSVDLPGDGAAAALDGTVVLSVGPPLVPAATTRLLRADTLQWEDAAAPPMAAVPADADTFAQCASWLVATDRDLLSLACNVGGFRSARFADGRWTPMGVPEVVSSSQVVGVQGAEDHVVVALEVPPSEGAFTSPTTALLIWVPDR